MAFIKFKIKESLADGLGATKNVQIKRLESDLPPTETYDLPLIMHALAKSSIELLRQSYITSEGQEYMTADGQVLWVRKPYKKE